MKFGETELFVEGRALGSKAATIKGVTTAESVSRILVFMENQWESVILTSVALLFLAAIIRNRTSQNRLLLLASLSNDHKLDVTKPTNDVGGIFISLLEIIDNPSAQDRSRWPPPEANGPVAHPPPNGLG